MVMLRGKPFGRPWFDLVSPEDQALEPSGSGLSDLFATPSSGLPQAAGALGHDHGLGGLGQHGGAGRLPAGGHGGDHDHGGHHHDDGVPHGFIAPRLPPGATENGRLPMLPAIELPEVAHDQGRGPGPFPKGAEAEPSGPEAITFDSSVVLSAISTSGIGIANGDTFKLHSLPGSRYTIFLDFDGHTTTGTHWNTFWNTSSFFSSAYSIDTSSSFSATELANIQRIWQRVAEYFSPFNINVTTEDPGVAGLSYSGTGDTQFGIRVVVTDEGGKNFGGYAYTGSFAWSSDTPAFVYANPLGDNTKYIADAAAHEAGHSLGLSHDGRGTDAYYWGHTGWAPVMGAGYDAAIVQWSNGAYTGANNTQDDLAIITGSANAGVAYRADDYGNSFATAAQLGGTVANGVASVQTYGIIGGSGARNDVDMFMFNVAAGGSINLTVSAWSRAHVTGSTTPVFTASPFSMLDAGLTLYNSSLQVVASWNETGRYDGVIQASGLAEGTYYLAIDGVGWGTPTATTPSGYTEYGSLGQYMVRGSYSAGTQQNVVLSFDRTSVTTSESGGAATVVLRAQGATGDVAVQIAGLDATEGSLSFTSFLLNAGNNWSASLQVSGRNDRDADGTVSYTLEAAAAGAIRASLQVSNLDNDIAPGSATTVSTNRNGALSQNSVSPSPVGADDGVAQSVTEGGSKSSLSAEARWQFTNLSAGDWRVQVDASAAREQFRFEFSTDNALSWRSFTGAPSSALNWTGDLVATGVGGTLWVRAIDVVRSGDNQRDTITVDLLTLAPVVDPLWG
jgi:hypothetical protein